MNIVWGKFWLMSRNRLKAGWLVASGLIAMYLGAIGPMTSVRGIAQQKSAGLASFSDWQPISLWQESRLDRFKGNRIRNSQIVCFAFSCTD